MFRLIKSVRHFATKSPLGLFRERELLYQNTAQPILDSSTFADDIRQQNQGKCAAYCGYDPSSNSLHLGNLVSIVMMSRLAQIGIEPIFLIGGATGMIGDPSGKSKERSLLNEKEIGSNLEGIEKDITTTYQKILHTLKSDPTKYQLQSVNTNYKVVNNAEFYSNMNVIDFLRNIGKNFRVNSLLAKQSVAKRMQSTEGLSYTEFSYGILQAHDFSVLNNQFGCVLQIGGSDQWGNITNGCDYLRRSFKKEVFAITMPLLLTPTGQKFGKSEGNALFLNPAKTPLSTIYQYLMSTPDNTIRSQLKILTCLPISHIQEMCDRHQMEPEKRLAQKTLCQQVSKMLTGRDFQNPHELFYKAGDLKQMSLQVLQANVLKLNSEDIFEVPLSELAKYRDFIDLLHSIGVRKHKSQIRREVDKGGLYLNNIKLIAEQTNGSLKQLIEKELLHNQYLIVRLGKKHYKVIRLC